MRTLGIVTTPPGHRAHVLLESVLGRSVLAYAADAVLASTRLSRAVIATGDPRIRETAEELGFELASAWDGASLAGSLEDLVTALEQDDRRPCDAVMVLPAIHPLRSREDIDGAIALLERTGADSVAAYTRRRPGAARFARIDAEGRVIDEAEPGNRAFLRDESLLCCRRQVLMERHSLTGADCRAWLLPPERSCAVEDDFDRFLLQQLLRYPGRPAA